jgi:hypothetical protein
MALRDSLHRLVDDLPETEIGRAERLLQAEPTWRRLHFHPFLSSRSRRPARR